jgi:hypothetical protein
MLAIKSTENSEAGSFNVKRDILERLRALAQLELYERQRWKPPRKALGFYAPGTE